MKPLRTRYKFLGQSVVKLNVAGVAYLRGVAGPFCATVEPLGRGQFSGRLSFIIPGSDGPPIPFVTEPSRSPKRALSAMETKARETGAAVRRALRAR